jgi:Fe-S cluster assembly protein SufD
LAPRAWQVAYQASEVDRQATLLSGAVAIGGDYARIRTDSKLVGEGATGKLIAVFFGAATQMHDFRTLQEHVAPKTNSDLLFKGAVAGHAHSVYSGVIRVHPGAKGHQRLSDQPQPRAVGGCPRRLRFPTSRSRRTRWRAATRRPSVPWTRSSATTLETRGVPTEVADRLIVLGFLKDVIGRLPVAGLQRYLEQVLTEKLDSSETTLLGGVA